MMSFEQKYHPTKISDVVFPDAHGERIIQGYMNAQKYEPLLLHGAWGSGKTTLAKLVPPAYEENFPENPNVQVGYVDVTLIEGGSSDRADVGMKRLKNKTGLVSANRSDKHYVIIDEAELLSKQYQRALRSLMTARPYVLFILTTNYINEIDEGLRSRCEKVPLDPAPAERWMDRAKLILNQENIIIPDEKLLALLKAHEGDNRDILRALENTVLQYKGLISAKDGPSHVFV